MEPQAYTRPLDSRVRFFSNYRERALGLTSVILAGKRDSRPHFPTSFCENGVVAKTSPRKVGDLVFSETRKGLAIIVQNNCINFVADKE